MIQWEETVGVKVVFEGLGYVAVEGMKRRRSKEVMAIAFLNAANLG